jgi:hypothetical protein
LHPEDLLELVMKQMRDDKTKRPKDEEAKRQVPEGGKVKKSEGGKVETQGSKESTEDRRLDIADWRSEDGKVQRIFNVGGGVASAMSLRQLSDWCEKEFVPHEVAVDLTPRAFDLPWVVLDSSRAENVWDWKPRRSVDQICEEIAKHAREHPDWLAISQG